MKKHTILAISICVLLLLSSFALFGAEAETLTEAGQQLQRFDVNADGKISISDVTTLLNYLSTGCGHNSITREAVAPSCTTVGYTEGTYCTICNENLIIPEEIPAIGHTFENGTCTVCQSPQPSEGLEYTLNGTSYAVTGLGTCSDSNIVIADFYEGKPVTSIGEGAFSSEKLKASLFRIVLH